MIISLLLNLLVAILGLIFYLLPNATTLPTFGSVNLDTVFSTGIGYYKYLATFFPPLTTVLTAASIYLGFRVTLLILKFILGSRLPSHR